MPEQDVGTPEKECANMEDKIVKIINEMAEYLNVAQMKKLQEVLLQTFSESEAQKEQISNEEYLKLFLDAKKIRAALSALSSITGSRWNGCCKPWIHPCAR